MLFWLFCYLLSAGVFFFLWRVNSVTITTSCGNVTVPGDLLRLWSLIYQKKKVVDEEVGFDEYRVPEGFDRKGELRYQVWYLVPNLLALTFLVFSFYKFTMLAVSFFSLAVHVLLVVTVPSFFVGLLVLPPKE
jgi:hypothetical protein